MNMPGETAIAKKHMSNSEAPKPCSSVAVSDRRESLRQRTVMRAARLSSRIHKVEGMGLVRNISEGGMLIESRLRFEAGEKIIVSLLDGDRIEGEVVWRDGNAFGVQFCSWIAVDEILARTPADPGTLRSRSPRLEISQPVLLRTGHCIFDARLCNISQRGAKILFAERLAINCRVQLIHDVLRPVSGNIKWQVDNLFGLEFYRTLDVDELTLWTVL